MWSATTDATPQQRRVAYFQRHGPRALCPMRKGRSVARGHSNLTYKDAVRLLEGVGGDWVDAVDKLLGGAILGTATLVNPGILTLLEPKNELVKLGREKVAAATDHLQGLSRASRTDRLEAAHAVLLISSYLDELTEYVARFGAEARVDSKDLSRLLAVKSEGHATDGGDFILQLTDAVLPRPSARGTRQSLRDDTRSFYVDLAPSVQRFLEGLRLRDELDDTAWGRLVAALRREVPDGALAKYEDSYRNLAVDVPEFRVWSSLNDVSATQHLVEATAEQVGNGLADLRALLLEMAPGLGVAAGLRGLLAMRHQAALQRPILDTLKSDLQGIVDPPSAVDAYINPSFRLATHDGNASPAKEGWWQDFPIRHDLQTFLATYFTTSQSWSTPLLVLGHPGAGKSLMTRILAAQLPEPVYVPVLVKLRAVPADTSIVRQIEAALHQLLNQDVSWAALAATAGSAAVPVVLLDGFDELLQASGISRSSYLEQVQEFQQTEAELGRRVAVVVTSRTVVADRARIPHGTLVVKLEPFSEQQVSAWVDKWNRANAMTFAARAVNKLSLETVLRHRQLAQQPILLLLLAVYDADGNPLQAQNANLHQALLYERLLSHFIRREVAREGYLAESAD